MELSISKKLLGIILFLSLICILYYIFSVKEIVKNQNEVVDEVSCLESDDGQCSNQAQLEDNSVNSTQERTKLQEGLSVLSQRQTSLQVKAHADSNGTAKRIVMPVSAAETTTKSFK